MKTILVLDEKNYTDDMPVFEKTGALPHMENRKAFIDNVTEFLK